MISDIDTSTASMVASANGPATPGLRFFIPAGDLDTFANDLTPRCRKLVKRRLRAMAFIHRAKKKFPACELLASTFHMERGWSAKTLHRLYLLFIEHAGDWRVLVDAAIAGPAWQNQLVPTGLPPAFLDYLAQQWAQKQRGKFTSVYSKLLLQLDRWRHGDRASAIPGFAEPPAASGLTSNDLPLGWTYSNLYKSVKPRVSQFALRMVRIGPKSAALSLGIHIPATRVGLAPGRYYIPDDSWNDFKVAAFGQTPRLLSFHFLDLFSGCNVKRGHKPAIKENEVEQRLKEREMVFLLVSLLTSEGYHPSGCTILCEKSTATIRERDRRVLVDCGIPITVDDGPAGGGPGVAGLFTGPGGGNPRWKAPMESWFNLLRNRTDDLIEFPGQTGSNSRLNQPEGLPGLEKDTQALMKAARSLTAERAELLRLGLLPYHEAIFALDAIIEVINCRIDHSLEGWRQCGHYIEEFRLNPQMRWQPVAALLDYAPEERTAIAAVLNGGTSNGGRPNFGLRRERALSPREVFDAGKGDLVKLPMAVAALLLEGLPEDCGYEATVKNNVLRISCPDVDPDAPLQFGLVRRDGRGTQTPLRNDEKFFVRVNPLDPRVAWLYTADRKFAGVAPYYGRVQRGDAHALHSAFAAKRQAMAPLVDEARRMAANITEAATDRAVHNSTVLGPTPNERANKKAAVEAAAESRDDLMSAML